MTTAPPNGTCKSCSSRDLRVFYRADSVPVNSCLLLNDQATARKFPTGRISLAFCRRCGFIGNLSFDSELVRYTDAYEEQQSFSPRFNEFAWDLAQRLIDRHGLRNKTVLEIGCGKGDFLTLLCRLGSNRGIGIDPTYIPGRLDEQPPEQVTFIRDFYSQRYAHLKADFVCCRHTLEHIPDTAAFVKTIREAIGSQTNTIVFFELPDIVRVLRDSAFWDIYHEHCSYFSLGSLARLFRAAGFEVLDLATAYDGQYLLLEARPSNGENAAVLKEEETLEELSGLVDQFQRNHDNHVHTWSRRIEAAHNQGQRVVIWGSGSKCVSFLSTLGIADHIECVVDINPYRQGKYLPSSGKRIIAPAELRKHRPDLVVAMNPVYVNEIRNDLKDLGLNPELTAV